MKDANTNFERKGARSGGRASGDVETAIDEYNHHDLAGLMALASSSASERNHFAEADKCFRSLLALDPADASTRSALASFLCERFVSNELATPDLRRAASAKLIAMASQQTA